MKTPEFLATGRSQCVLLTVRGVRGRLTWFDEDDVLAAAKRHALAPAFDIGLGSRRELRILPSALDFYSRTKGARRRVTETELWDEVLRGHDGKPWIAGERLRLTLNCGSGHLLNLLQEGELVQMPGTNYRRGPDGSARIPLDSVKDFLQRRRL